MKWKKPAKFTTIETTWKGIFVTCNRGREQQCAREVQHWFSSVVEESPEWDEAEAGGSGLTKEGSTDDLADLESSIANEVAALTSKKRQKVVVHPNLGVECVVFAQLRQPIDPVKLTEKLCKIAQSGQRVTKYIQRLGPVQQFIKIDAETLDLSALQPVLAATLRDQSKFAIRPTLRLSPVDRSRVIPAVARLVGPNHSVSLTDFDQLILVEGFKGVLGLAVFDLSAKEVQDYHRFNIAQIIAHPTDTSNHEDAPKKPEQPEQTDESKDVQKNLNRY